jgi:amino acid transporter
MSTTLKWGLITGMVYVLFSLISNMLGIQQGGGGNMGLGLLVNFLLMLATFFTIYLGVKETRDQDLGGFLTMGQGFMAGLKMALIAGVIAGLFTLIYMKFIDPDMTDRIMEGAEAQWDEYNVPEEQREMSRKFTGMFLNPFIMAPFMILWIAFWGVIKSLVAGAMLKKLPPVATPMT